MGIFSNILAKLGFGDKKEEAPAVAPPAPASTPVPVPVEATTPVATPVPLPTPAISEVDVVAQLTAMAAASREKLNWKVSIVDLLKLLGLDSSLASRKELAVELGCPPEKMGDSAQMNMWLHKTVLRKLADNGGNIPADLL
jgi:3-oxoacyl-ACP reductase-like protein